MACRYAKEYLDEAAKKKTPITRDQAGSRVLKAHALLASERSSAC